MASAGFYKHFGSRPEIGAPRAAGPRKRFARPGRRIENPLTLIIEEPRGAAANWFRSRKIAYRLQHTVGFKFAGAKPKVWFL